MFKKEVEVIADSSSWPSGRVPTEYNSNRRGVGCRFALRLNSYGIMDSASRK